MTINWKVIWKDENDKKHFRLFPGSSPKESGAGGFFRELKDQGHTAYLISANKAWPPTQKQEVNRRPGLVWCPYCVKWRNFKLYAIRKPTYVTEALMRCPVCGISSNDYYVRQYNGFIERITEQELIKKLTRDEHAIGV